MAPALSNNSKPKDPMESSHGNLHMTRIRDIIAGGTNSPSVTDVTSLEVTIWYYCQLGDNASGSIADRRPSPLPPPIARPLHMSPTHHHKTVIIIFLRIII